MKKETDTIGMYFIAIIPPTPIFEEALELKHYFRDQYNSKASLNSPPHITLHMPFQWKLDKENLLTEGLGGFAKQQAPFELSLLNFNAFPPRVIYIDVVKSEMLEVLQKELQRFCKRELNLFNANYKEHPFHPHLTLAFRDLRKQQFVKAWEEFKARDFKGQFIVREIALLKHVDGSWRGLKNFTLASIHQ